MNSVVLVLLFSLNLALSFDPYQVLELDRFASPNQIKLAYKRLAKQWHPERSPGSEDSSTDKFTEINEAYEVLIHPQKRDKFDRFGLIDLEKDNPKMPEWTDSTADSHADLPPDYDDPYSLHKLSFKMYENKLVPQSYLRPYIILTYSETSENCSEAKPIWLRASEELERQGYGVGTINFHSERPLAQKLRVNGQSLPSIVVLIDGKFYHYRYKTVDYQLVMNFAKNLLPTQLIAKLTPNNFERFLRSNPSENKLSAVWVTEAPQSELRHFVVSHRFKDFLNFGHVSLDESEFLRQQFGLAFNATETLLVFNERLDHPIGTFSTPESWESNAVEIVDFLNRLKFLLLPRISSQTHLDQLCQPESVKRRRHLCAVLMLDGTAGEDEIHLNAYRNYAEYLKSTSERVRFVYMLKRRQSEFISSLRPPTEKVFQSARDVLILWRVDRHQIQYDWVKGGFGGFANRFNSSVESLNAQLHYYLQSNGDFPSHEQILQEVANEHKPHWFKTLAVRLRRFWETLVLRLEQDQLLPALSVLGTFILIVGVGYGLNYLVTQEKLAEEEEKKKKKGGKMVPIEQSREFASLVKELKAETYFGFVRLLKPGCRSIIILCDQDTKSCLVRRFTKIVWPWRKNRTLLFGYLLVDKNLAWYSRLLAMTLVDPTPMHINPRNVVGTVLALNGFRRYFNIFHAKLPLCAPVIRVRKGRPAGAKLPVDLESGGPPARLSAVESGEEDSGGSEADVTSTTPFIRGTEVLPADTSAAATAADLLLTDEMLAGLPRWLDKLFDGSKAITRHYIPEWPEGLRSAPNTAKF